MKTSAKRLDTLLWMLAAVICFGGCAPAATGPAFVGPAPQPPPLLCIQAQCNWEETDAGVTSEVECPTKDFKPTKLEMPINGGELISCICCKR